MSLPMGKYRRGICPAVLSLPSALSLSHAAYSSIFFLENTTIPNIHEVKENMTMGTTLVTNPSGGFLVREGGEAPLCDAGLHKGSTVNYPYQTQKQD